MESNESDIGWQWGEQAKAWVQLADSASTVAEAATIWGYDEELATQWITGWALHHGWAHELHTEGIEQIWHKLRNDTWADAQLDTEPQQHHPLTEPGHHSPFAWEPSAADIVDQPADAWSGLGHHGRYTPSEWSATYAVEPVADTTSRQAQPQPPTAPGLSEADVEEILAHAMSGPSKAEMLAGLAGKESVEALAINWRLTVRQVDGWARQYAQVSWDWPIETPVEHMRAQLRSLKIEDGPRTGYAPSLPEFTERQLRLLAALKHLEDPTIRNIGVALGMDRSMVAACLTTIGQTLDIEGTAGQIRSTLFSRLHPPGDLSILDLSWLPEVMLPTAGAFTPEQTQLLAALRDMVRPTLGEIAYTFGVTVWEVRSRLTAIGGILGIEGSSAQIVTKLVPRLRVGGNLAGLVPSLPPDPLSGQTSRKRRYPDESP